MRFGLRDFLVPPPPDAELALGDLGDFAALGDLGDLATTKFSIINASGRL